MLLSSGDNGEPCGNPPLYNAMSNSLLHCCSVSAQNGNTFSFKDAVSTSAVQDGKKSLISNL